MKYPLTLSWSADSSILNELSTLIIPNWWGIYLVYGGKSHGRRFCECTILTAHNIIMTRYSMLN